MRTTIEMKPEQRQLLLVGALLLLVLPSGALADQPHPFQGNRLGTVMTRNLYLGADLEPLFTAGTQPEFLSAAAGVFASVQATNFPERAEALADEIAATRPDLVGLQEVALWRTQLPPDFSPTPNATTVEFDFLELLLTAIAARGVPYVPVAITIEQDVEAPALLPDFATCCREIRLTMRDVILARADLKTADLKLSNPQGANFEERLLVVTPVGFIEVVRGWASVDVKIRGKTFRLITTHLESLSPLSRFLQAEELLAGPANTHLPVVLLGDFNASPGEPTYDLLTGSGFTDTWTIAGFADGATCCQAADLLNLDSALDERFDLVLFRGNFGAVAVDLVGEATTDRTESGFWPSDHAGVVATLSLP